MQGTRFSQAMEEIRMSPIVAISEIVKERAPRFREETGKDFIYFQRGEIDFPTPSYIKDAAKRALDEDRTKYPISGGEAVFKDAVLRKLESYNKALGLSRENIVCTYGGQEALQLAFKLFEGKRGAGFSPCWSCTLENFIPYARVEFIQVPLEADFSIDFDKLENVLKDSSFFYLNTPHNPTGKVFSGEEIRTIAEICRRHDVYIISDEAYEKILYDRKEHFSPLSLDFENIISAFTFSKSYSMTGWRIGYLVTRDKRIPNLIRLGDYSQTAGVVTFLQYAAREALDNTEAEGKAVKKMTDEFQKRRDALYDGLRSIEGMKVEKPSGAFYMFPNFSAFIPDTIVGKERERYMFDILMNHGIATVYGSCFGTHFIDNIRLSFSATPIPAIEEGIKRFREALANPA